MIWTKERLIGLRALNTMAPNGYNLRAGGVVISEKLVKYSRQLMIEKQREISLRRGGLLGTIKENKSK
jgi:hypothetical protein